MHILAILKFKQIITTLIFPVEMEEIRTVKCKKLLYVWNPQRKTFVKLRGLDSGTTRAMLHECEGYNVHEQALK